MSRLYLLTFELNHFSNDPRHAYASLKYRLRTLGAVPILLNQWVLRSDHHTAQSLKEDLSGWIGEGDRFTDCEVSGDWASWWALVEVRRA